VKSEQNVKARVVEARLVAVHKGQSNADVWGKAWEEEICRSSDAFPREGDGREREGDRGGHQQGRDEDRTRHVSSARGGSNTSRSKSVDDTYTAFYVCLTWFIWYVV